MLRRRFDHVANHPAFFVDRNLAVYALKDLQHLIQTVGHDRVDPELVLGCQLDQLAEFGWGIVALSEACPAGERKLGGPGTGRVFAAAVVDVVAADVEHGIAESLA